LEYFQSIKEGEMTLKNGSQNKIRQNLHTHSIYDDGRDTIDEMVLSAIDKGFTVLGFSGHSFNHPLDEGSMSESATEKYIQDVKTAKEKYKDQIEIVLGIEQDSLSDINREDYEYVIGSLHYLIKESQKVPVDYSEEKFEEILNDLYQGDIEAMILDYCDQFEQMIEKGSFEILGHIDLITKYNENEKYFSFDHPMYLQKMKSLIQKAADKGIVFEMNSGAISRGYRTEAYPAQNLLKMIRQANGKLCINTDCHNRDHLDCNIAKCIERAKEAGFTELMHWNSETGKLVSEDIDLFY